MTSNESLLNEKQRTNLLENNINEILNQKNDFSSKLDIMSKLNHIDQSNITFFKTNQETLEKIILDLKSQFKLLEQSKIFMENKFIIEINKRDQMINQLRFSFEAEQQNKSLLEQKLSEKTFFGFNHNGVEYNSRIAYLEEKLRQTEQMNSELKMQINSNSQRNYFLNKIDNRANEFIGTLASNGSANGAPVFRGPRGGIFYINNNNNKSYCSGLNNVIRYIF